jgi:hypothetical protein
MRIFSLAAGTPYSSRLSASPRLGLISSLGGVSVHLGRWSAGKLPGGVTGVPGTLLTWVLVDATVRVSAQLTETVFPGF